MLPKKLPKISQKNKDLVNGFIREHIERPYNYKSASELNYLFILFLCANQDKLIPPQLHGGSFSKGFQVTNDQIMVDSTEMKKYDYFMNKTIYGTNQISTGIHYWRFAIDKVGLYVRLGIISVSGDDEYSLILCQGRRLMSTREGVRGDNDPYFKRVTDGQMIEMKLNLNTKKLYYKFNNMGLFEAAFGEIGANTYRLMVHVSSDNDVNWRLLEYSMSY